MSNPCQLLSCLKEVIQLWYAVECPFPSSSQQMCLSLLQVKIYSGPRLLRHLKFGPLLAKSLKMEYGALECTVEIVDDVNDAIRHINQYGSEHTDAIVTDDGLSALFDYLVRFIPRR
jgi:hypothetical protein